MGSRLDGKVAIVTGAGSANDAPVPGVGEAIAIVLAREGASVLLVDRDRTRAESTRRKLEEHPGEGRCFDADISQAADCEAMVRAAVDQFGGLDILVNNAALARHAPLTETTDELYDDVLAVNLKGTFLASRAAVPELIARGGGSIVNIGSVASLQYAGKSQTAYAASKAGQLGLTVDLAGEYGRNNIRVNAVLPGSVATPMMAASGKGLSSDVTSRLNMLGRTGTAWDIAHAVLFLCGDEGSYITGVTLPVDGGATTSMPGAALRPR